MRRGMRVILALMLCIGLLAAAPGCCNCPQKTATTAEAR